MRFEEFKAGRYVQRYQHKSFVPSTVNHPWVWGDAKINILFEEASRRLGELSAFALIVPDVDTFIVAHIAKEAEQSSRIEGTRTEFDEIFMDATQLEPEKRDDWQEVQNYITAINHALDALDDLPISTRLLCETHAILMKSVRGEHKAPGELRCSQNWIGGSNLNDAFFIPPPHEDVPELMGDLEKFLNNQNIDVPHLIRIAIAHYQFETIHPFLDGNGRIGRLLITLYLVRMGLLRKPLLYLSSYMESHKGSYYNALTMVRSNNALIHWIRFFLVAIIETAKKGQQTLVDLLHLKNRLDKQVMDLGKRATKGHLLLTNLYKQPIVNAETVREWLGVTHPSANDLIGEFVRLGILKETTGYRRNRIFAFAPYLDVFRF